MTPGILVINAGSSSVKFAVYARQGDELKLRLRGQADGLGNGPRLRIDSSDGERLHDAALDSGSDQQTALDAILRWLEGALDSLRLVAVGHRVVHGGRDFSEPVLIEPEILERLRALNPLAPLHQPHNLQAIDTLGRLRPGLPQVACFDTAFHRTQPAVAQRFALPYEYGERGIVRYGFHGLSYEYIAQVLPQYDAEAAKGRVVVAHLGNGSSMCALRAGRSVATTMGFTALDGLVMGERCGTIDPGVVLHLLQREGMSVAQVEELLYRRSGLLGMSGISGDMRRLLQSDVPRAREALDVYVYRALRELGSLVAALEGLDAVVFTAGIGENAAPIRERICRGLEWLGLEFDDAANEQGSTRISAPGSRVSAWVIPTDEEQMIAQHTVRLLG